MRLMLVLARKPTETIVIEVLVDEGGNVRVEEIVITVQDVKSGRVKLGIDAPKNWLIRREPR